MKGQWLGSVNGSNSGFAIINIDDRERSFSGVLYFFDHNEAVPNLSVHFEFDKSSSKTFECTSTKLFALRPGYYTEVAWNEIQNLYTEELNFPTSVELVFEMQDSKLKVVAKTNVDTKVEGLFESDRLDLPSTLPENEMSWEQFKLFVLTNEKEFIYRGQSQPWKLQTSFHRRGRYDLTRYLAEDIPQLHRALSSKTSHVFNLDNSLENGAFINLAQHHGYPTPLLDWSNSPYVAAFFAFRGISSEDAKLSPQNKVRIFLFDAKHWKKRLIQNQHMLTGQMHVSVIDLLAIENNRMVPQQATTTVTNVADIESFISFTESNSGETFLQVIDIPWKERDTVVRELTLMGLTAGSLFPGLDGTCEELKEKMF